MLGVQLLAGDIAAEGLGPGWEASTSGVGGEHVKGKEVSRGQATPDPEPSVGRTVGVGGTATDGGGGTVESSTAEAVAEVGGSGAGEWGPGSSVECGQNVGRRTPEGPSPLAAASPAKTPVQRSGSEVRGWLVGIGGTVVSSSTLELWYASAMRIMYNVQYNVQHDVQCGV